MKKKYSSFLLLIFFLVISVIVIFKMWPETKAKPKSVTSITIKFSPGDKTEAFEEKEYELTANSINNYVTIPEDFAKTVDMIEKSYHKKVDDETFYFDESDYSYTFTGWKIDNSSKFTWQDGAFTYGFGFL